MKQKEPPHFPPEWVTAPIREKLSDPKYKGSHLPPDASELYRAKYKISQLVIGYSIEHKPKRKDLAKKLGIDEARISEILRGRIQRFTLDRLIGIANILYPNLKVQIIA